MYLSNKQIELILDKILVKPDRNLINTASYDLTLAKDAIYRGKKINLPFTLFPGDFILVSSNQYWKFPCDVAGQLLLKSSIGRQAINHMLAGWFDPDFHGSATMELKNEGHEAFTLTPNMRIAQMVFHLGYPTTMPYRLNGKYHGQSNTTPALKEKRKIDKSDLWLAGPFIDNNNDQFYNKHIYEKWIKEIEKKLNKHNGKINKETISKIKNL